MPKGAVYVGRPTRWGNPFVVRECPSPVCRADRLPAKHWHYYDPDAGALSVSFGTRAEAVHESVRRYTAGVLDNGRDLYEYLPRPDQVRGALAGRDLACWCPLDSVCHADTLLMIANGGAA
jgi:hypothetical protein